MSLDPLTAALDIGGKLCSHCNEVKPPAEFRIRNDTGKPRSECKSCASIKEKLRYKKRSAEISEQYKNKREDDIVWKILRGAKGTANKKGLEFNLEEVDIVIPEKCPLLLEPLTNIQGMGFVFENASIDRIDSTKGYIKGNIQIISRRANSMKNDATKEQLITFAKQILKHYGETNGNS